MCGICGYYNYTGEAAIGRMLAAMVHRGPDEEGRHVGDGIGLGIRRLSIIDVAGGHQPAYTEDRTVCVVLNGEIYNYRQLRDDLVRKGHRPASQSDTEVIGHLYEEHGPLFVEKLQGMFAIALWDARKKTLLLYRDRLGIKPLYFARRGAAWPRRRACCPSAGAAPTTPRASRPAGT